MTFWRGRKGKYNAVKTEVDGLKFPSKAEARTFSELRLLVKCGEVKWFIRQPSFDLPGGVRYRADFLAVWSDGRVRVLDTKGIETEAFKIKMRLMKEAYPLVTVELVKKGIPA